jgi:hypothetical protein
MKQSTVIFLLLALLPAMSSSAESTSAEDSLRLDSRVAMASTALFPGLGQLYTGGKKRTAVYMALETLCLVNIVREEMRSVNYRRHADSLSEGEIWRGRTPEQLEADSVRSHEESVDWRWTLAAVMVFAFMDSYDYSHLSSFDMEEIEGLTLLPILGPDERVGLQLGLSF